MRHLPTALLISLLILLLPGATRAQNDALTPVTVTRQPLTASAPCTGAFIARDLPHTTTSADGVIRMYQANGAGLAAGDLDGDGDLDLLLGAEHGPNTLLWNEGGLDWRKAALGDGPTRAITIVDVDGDGRRDVALTTHTGVIHYWRNQGAKEFARATLPGVTQPAYVLAWADLDQDDDLDLVTGAYDAGFLADRGGDYLLAGGGGIFVYENQGARFGAPAQLADGAQALALATLDLNDDGLLDLVVGNDFDVPDYTFLQTGAGLGRAGWAEATPFTRTSHSTMSLDVADVNNDGRWELFAADMKPVARDVDTLAAWVPIMQDGYETRRFEDAQRNENMLQQRDRSGRFRNVAYGLGIDATGWSWSSQFGDLDNDGRLDLYAVNGMMEAELLAHLPNHELVEENQALRNAGARFEPAPGWGLNATRSGRGMIMADLDQDGDLDIVVNNLRAPAQLFENRLCGGHGLLVDLEWPDSANSAALGATVILHTTEGSQQRPVANQRGYLSGSPAQVHFGLPPDVTPLRLEILWPDSKRSQVTELAVNELVRVTRQP